MIFTRDFVTRENDGQIASLVTQKSLFMVTHALLFISCSSIMKDFNYPNHLSADQEKKKYQYI